MCVLVCIRSFFCMESQKQQKTTTQPETLTAVTQPETLTAVTQPETLTAVTQPDEPLTTTT